MNEGIEKIKNTYLKQTKKGKCKKLNISNEMLDFLISQKNNDESCDILNIITKSKNSEDFKNQILNYWSNSKNPYISNFFLLGTITNNYSLFSLYYLNCENFKKENFEENNNEHVLQILKEHFFDYVASDNNLKNKFLIDTNGGYDFNLDLKKEWCDKIFDDVVNGLDKEIDSKKGDCYIIARDYITNIIGIYGKDNIINHFDFILYDMSNKKEGSLEDRKEKYLKRSNLTDEENKKIENINILKEKLKTIPLEEAKDLLKRLDAINERNIDELENIYLEYESLFRKDIVSRLFVPKEKYTFIEDFRDLRPQMLHLFFRDTENFRNQQEEKLKNEIRMKRAKNKEEQELTEEEQREFEKRKMLLDKMLDQTQVNYSFDGKENVYSDKNGFTWYHSDTNNQLSATIYSDQYFLKAPIGFQLGIGFNEEGLKEEAIALSSEYYLTTNKGLNNLEYNQEKEFETLSSTYQELIKNDGKSEILLFRRGMDYDTKSSYVFLTINSKEPEKCKEYIKQAKELADKNDLKLVVYDLHKIKESYQQSLMKMENYGRDDEGKRKL